MPDDVDDDLALRWWTRGASVRPADPDDDDGDDTDLWTDVGGQG
jgi:hypothetical protein